ncbi:MAG: hypothetical protein PWP28_134 [Oceanotoga sp.]|uniref:hypothetical protein n=1 Tax=Oceanotoga sp. TaxID=2108366 RepID=UPI00264EAF03|nr:hypothetical protein [Oceanotoga sp.]MDN5341259.1 hypothetical protein [Oceanotoga sp.]
MNQNGVMKFIYGIIFIFIGLLIFFRGYINVNIWEYIWPLFILLAGFGFEISYFGNRRQDPGILVPGGILTFLGIFFFFNAFTRFSYMDTLWPLFIFAPAVGLFQLAYHSKNRAVMIPVYILTGVSFVFLMINIAGTKIGSSLIGAGLVILGVLILLNMKKENR